MRAKELLKEYHHNSKDEKCPHCGGPMFSETLMMEKKDACYYKVKSRYKVWPSAYASGALVKCRKKGASNWGNKSEGVAEAFGPLPRDNQQIRLGRHTVNIERVGEDKNYIGFAWHDSKGQEHYEEVSVGDLGSYDDLIDRIKQEISYQERQYTDQGVAEGSDELYQKAIRKYAQRVAHDYLGGGNEYLYGANKFDSEMFGVDPKQAQQDFKTLFPQYLKKLQGGEQGVAEEGYGNHPSQRVDPRTGKKYVPPKSPLGQGVAEGWSQKYKKSINCSHPKGFSQKAHCAGKKKHNESIEMEMTCPNCGMCETHGDHSRNTLDEACWKGYHKEGNKKMFGKTYPNCVKNTNEEQELDENLHKWFKEKWVRFGPDGKIRGDCARGDDSEGKPKCLPQSKAHSLGKKGRASAAARKRREDPNPERSGKAINVNTKKKSNEDITEISDVTKQSYKQQAQQQVKDLKPHAEKGEYKDIAQRAIDRRERGLKRLGK
jgi:hypothetical protein